MYLNVLKCQPKTEIESPWSWSVSPIQRLFVRQFWRKTGDIAKRNKAPFKRARTYPTHLLHILIHATDTKLKPLLPPPLTSPPLGPRRERVIFQIDQFFNPKAIKIYHKFRRRGGGGEITVNFTSNIHRIYYSSLLIATDRRLKNMRLKLFKNTSEIY